MSQHPTRPRFQAWVASLTEADHGDIGGEPVAGTVDFLAAVFDEHGPIEVEQVAVIWAARQESLAREAVDLVAADIRATTTAAIDIDVRWQDDLLGVSFNGNYQTPAMFSISGPEAICEVAENLQDHVMDEVWTVWPVCPTHGRGLAPQPVDGTAAWVCPSGHTVAAIGNLH